MTEVRKGRRSHRSVGDAAIDAAERQLAGYSLVRTLGRGDDARVLLGVHPGHTAAGGDSPHDPVAVKIFDRPGTDQAVAAELSTLDAVMSPHVVRLIDVAALPGEPVCAILERYAGGSLAALLRRADGLAAGEAVTILAGVARGVAALHDVGRQHGRLAATRVLFDDSGRPVLVGLGGVRWSDDDGADDRTVDTRSDAMRFGSLCDQVLSSVRDPDRPDQSAVRRIVTLTHDESTEFEDALFALAPPSPITRLLEELAESDTSTRRNPRTAMALRDAGHPDRVGPDEQAPEGESGPRAIVASLGALALEHLDESPIALARHRMGAWLHTHRRPAIAGIGAALALTIGAVLLMPSRATPTGTTPSPRSEETSHAQLPAALSPGTTPSTSPPTAVGRPRAVVGDDPISAATELINHRHRCFATRSDRCLASVDQVGSDLLLSDVAALRGASSRDSDLIDATVAASAVELVNRTGGAAIVSVGADDAQPDGDARADMDGDANPGVTAARDTPRALGSALLVRGPNGWRLRDVWPRR